MKTKHRNIILCCIVAVLLVATVILILGLHKSHQWDANTGYNVQGEDPYDYELFDELLRRSLPKGYTVHQPQKIRTEAQHNEVRDNLLNTPMDTALLLIATPQYHDFPDIDVMQAMTDFAKKGGHGVLVVYNSAAYDPFEGEAGKLKLGWDMFGGRYVDPYTREWYARQDGGIQRLVTGQGDTLNLDKRFNVHPFFFENYYNENDRSLDGLYMTMEDPQGDPCEVYLTLAPVGANNQAYLMDVYYPGGGHLTITSLGLYFSNLGLRLPDGPKLIGHVMGNIDDRPVKRWMYPRDHMGSWNKPNAGGTRSIIDKIGEDPALSLVWVLLLGGAVLWLLTALVRRYPVMRGAEVDMLDKTDAVAVREYQFRHSPLLHFMFQCSWLYNGAKDYRELFEIDFRRLSRVVSRMTGIDLRQATDTELDTMSRTIAAVLKRPEAEIKSELKWMRDFYESIGTITRKAYAYGHYVVESYPF